MKFILPIIFGFFCFSQATFASQDSVAVFYKQDKVVVMIKDYPSSGRLQEFITIVGGPQGFRYQSDDKMMRLECGQNSAEAVCTFGFEPTVGVQFIARGVQALVPVESLAEAEFVFVSSRGDQVKLRTGTHGLEVIAQKK